jgi:flavin reductase (DIM6/NTAB) family NADH-FMN oxidoreductase RutF
MSATTMGPRIDPGAMRRTLGRFTTGVTVVTTARGSEVHAMTANAFTSVSLNPPLVLVSIDHRTRMHRMLPDTRRYGVSVLASDQERTAWHFAGRPLRDPGELFEWAGDVAYVRGAIAHVGCSLHAAHEAGDHTLYLGRVEHLHSRPGEPLLFHRGAFGRVSPEEQVLAHSWGW